MARYQNSPEPIRREIEGDIFRRHFGLVKILANEAAIEGMSTEDKAAECFPAFLKAIREYSPDKTASLKSFIKLCVRRKLIDLYRQQNQCSAIPQKFLLSLQAIAADGEEMTLEDVIASDEDITINAEHEAEARLILEALNGVSFDKLMESVESASRERNPRLMLSYSVFANYLAGAGVLTPGELTEVSELLTDMTAQGQLFDLGPGRQTEEARDLLSKVFTRYIAVQTEVLLDKADGYLIPEISERCELPLSVVTEMLAAVAEIRGEIETPILRAA